MGLSVAPTLSENYDHVYSKDPAIDTAADSYDPDGYARDGRESCLPTKPGATAAVFRVQHLRGRAKTAVIDMQRRGDGEFTFVLDVVSLALVEVRNVVMDDGKEFSVSREYDRSLKLHRVTDDCMAQLWEVDDGALVVELASRVLRETFGNPLS